MNNQRKIAGTSALVWAIITLLALALMVAASSIRGSDIYDISRGVDAITESSIILFGAHVVFAWSGAALVFAVVAIYDWLPAEARAYPVKTGTAFGIIAGALFLLYGLIGGFGFADLSYVQSVRSADYIREAYLPLSIITNRTLAAAITVSGLWFGLTNWFALQSKIWPSPVSFLGLGAGAIALLGFVLPGGGFSLLGVLLGVIWAIMIGLQLLRRSQIVASESTGVLSRDELG